jgi:hypothetical protein
MIMLRPSCLLWPGKLLDFGLTSIIFCIT